jgi:hypothetical protein
MRAHGGPGGRWLDGSSTERHSLIRHAGRGAGTFLTRSHTRLGGLAVGHAEAVMCRFCWQVRQTGDFTLALAISQRHRRSCGELKLRQRHFTVPYAMACICSLPAAGAG